MLKQIVDRSPWLTHLNYFKGQVLYRLGISRHKSGATHARFDLDESVRYVQFVAQDYLCYAGVSEDFIHGKRILEIGPGDNLGVGLLFLAKGAASYVAVDRFYPVSDDQQNHAVYRRLYDAMTLPEKERVEDVLSTHNGAKATLTGERLTAQYNCSIEEVESRIANAEFDVIISRAVLEHVFDLEAAWENMVAMLNPNGRMWHKVDFRNHGFYDQFHPLFFLTVPRRIWRFVSQPDPTLNRHRSGKYRELADRYFQKTRVFCTHVLQHPEFIPHLERIELDKGYDQSDLESLELIRPRLASEFAGLSDEELLVNGIFIICGGKKE